MVIKEPSRRFGEDKHSNGEYDGRNYLETPWNSERRVAFDVGATKLYKILDENTPRNRPLLNRDEATANRGRSNLCLIKWDGSRCDTDGDAGDNSAGYQHNAVLCDGSGISLGKGRPGAYDGGTL